MVLDRCHSLAGGWFCGVEMRGDTFWEVLVRSQWHGICQLQKVRVSLDW